MTSLGGGSIDPRKATLVCDFLKEAFPGHNIGTSFWR